ncbi:MAG: hypothetical protein JOY84_01630 [Curvibacter sp.]|nr:hypothetical protein [Curvibacter sp.]
MPDSLNTIHTSDEEDDGDPTHEESEQIRRATQSDAKMVDELILQSCTNRWRKVAMIVGLVANAFEKKFPHLPAIYLPIRIIEMERSGVLEVAGDAMDIRFSEVRLGRSKTN